MIQWKPAVTIQWSVTSLVGIEDISDFTWVLPRRPMGNRAPHQTLHIRRTTSQRRCFRNQRTRGEELVRKPEGGGSLLVVKWKSHAMIICSQVEDLRAKNETFDTICERLQGCQHRRPYVTTFLNFVVQLTGAKTSTSRSSDFWEDESTCSLSTFAKQFNEIRAMKERKDDPLA